jgi:uncharacterized membrane protein
MAKIFRSSVINAPIDEVWARIRDFNALPDWHPAFTDSHIENDAPGDKERGRNNFPNYASQLQATFARSQITKISK